jgi:serine protease Do
MRRITSYVVIISVVIISILIGGLIYQLRQEQVYIKELIEKAKQSEKNVVERVVVERDSGNRWRNLQTQLKDTVVQIFSHVAEFNWLEPYKTPNQYQAMGSGFFISDEGYIVTNAHVIDQTRGVSVQIPSFGKRRFDVEVIGMGADRDLALLRLRQEDRAILVDALGTLPVLKISDSDVVRRADEVMAIGYPLGQQSLKSTTGVVSGREHIMGQHMIQISAPINPGSSGGPSVNATGEVIGVNTANVPGAQNVGYIIPSNELKLFLRQMEQLPPALDPCVKLLRKPILGILYNNANDAVTGYLGNPDGGGLYVTDTVKGSLLQKAGVQAGDMIYEIDSHRLDVFGEMNVPWSEDKMSIVDYTSRLMFGDTISLVIYRKGVRKQISFTYQQGDLLPIRRIYPGCEKISYEVLGGMIVMSLSINHLPLLISAAPELAYYADFKRQMEPVLIITHVLPDSQAARSRALGAGAIISAINGDKVKTLEEFRNAVKKGMKTGFLTVRTSEDIFTALPLAKVIEEETKLATNYYYQLSPFVKELIAETQQGA